MIFAGSKNTRRVERVKGSLPFALHEISVLIELTLGHLFGLDWIGGKFQRWQE